MSYPIILDNVLKNLKEQETLESVYDLDFFKELEKKLKPAGDLDAKEKEVIGKMLATPSIMPKEFDKNFQAWLIRVSLWGKVKMTRIDPEHNVRKELSASEFLAYIDNRTMDDTRGLWEMEELDINKMRIFRDFWSYLGKNITEEIIVEIDLRQDLKDALKKARKKLGWF